MPSKKSGKATTSVNPADPDLAEIQAWNKELRESAEKTRKEAAKIDAKRTSKAVRGDG